MKRVAITDAAFATLIDGVKNSLSEDMYRPELSYIKLVAKNGTDMCSLTILTNC